MNEPARTPAEVAQHAQSLIDFYGPPISVYSRADAVSDGTFVDVSGHEVTRMFGIKFPVHLSRALHQCAVLWTPEDQAYAGGSSEAARLNTLLQGFTAARQEDVRRSGGRGSTLRFTVDALVRGSVTDAPVEVFSEVTPGDHLEPLITFWLDEERRD